MRTSFPPWVVRRLQHLDVACATIRHITEHSCRDLEAAVVYYTGQATVTEAYGKGVGEKCFDGDGSEGGFGKRGSGQVISGNPRAFYEEGFSKCVQSTSEQRDVETQTDLQLLRVMLVTPSVYEAYYTEGAHGLGNERA